jgi:hypothetical protein
MRLTSMIVLVSFLAACAGAVGLTITTDSPAVVVSSTPVQATLPAPESTLPPTDTPQLTATFFVPTETPIPEPSLTPTGDNLVLALPDPAA